MVVAQQPLCGCPVGSPGRAAGELLGGLNQPLSASEIQSLRERFTVSAEEAAKCENSDYYATKLPPGPGRLAEMIEESALYSEHLQRISARAMLFVMMVFVMLSSSSHS